MKVCTVVESESCGLQVGLARSPMFSHGRINCLIVCIISYMILFSSLEQVVVSFTTGILTSLIIYFIFECRKHSRNWISIGSTNKTHGERVYFCRIFAHLPLTHTQNIRACFCVSDGVFSHLIISSRRSRRINNARADCNRIAEKGGIARMPAR